MARILPSQIDISSLEKDAEQKVLLACRDELPDDWIALYSLWIREPFLKKKSEVDILVITKKAVICLEIKGGGVVRRPDGVWEFYTKRGKLVREKREGPFEQSMRAHFDVRQHLEKNKKRNLARLPWWYGVVTPDCTLYIPPDEIGIAPQEYCDEMRFFQSFRAFMDDLEAYAVAKNRRNKVGGISPKIREELVNTLRPSIRPVDGLGIQIKRLERRFEDLTSTQKRGLDQAKANPSICLQGGAGTGKTLLAFEMACEKAREGKRVIFTCFNRHLSGYLSNLVRGDQSLENLLIANYHQLLANICRSAGLSATLPEDWNELNSVAMSVTEQAIERIEEFAEFDYLVIDEGQDLMRRDFLDVLDLLLVNGLDLGNWLICLDPEQAIFADHYDSETEEWLRGKIRTHLTLEENVRNTIPIAAYSYGLSAISARPKASTAGDQPEILYFQSREELAKKLKKRLNIALDELLKSRGHASSITVLMTRTQPYLQMLEEISSSGLIRLGQVYDPSNINEEKFSWSTVQAFKGLEADIVVLLGISDLTSLEERRLLYVGASRARAHLVMFLPVSEGDNVGSRMASVLELLQSS
jgi:hypothetical protein